MKDIEIGARVRRMPGGRKGTVVEIADRPARQCTTQLQRSELRIRVLWDAINPTSGYQSDRATRTWLAVSGEGTRWERLIAEAEGGA